MEGLCKGLQENPSVELLYAEGNQIGDQGANAISNLLKQQDPALGLEGLFLGANRIGVQGAKDFASTLSQNKTLTKLYLEGNNIGLDGASAFSDALEGLEGSATLKHLFGDNNNSARATTR